MRARIRHRGRLRRVGGSVVFLLLLWGCRSGPSSDAVQKQHVERAQHFRALLQAAQFDSAQTFLAQDARRWWNERQGPGSPWTVAAGKKGPWAGWDEHFRSRTEAIEWRATADAAILLQRETNDYFQLLERGWVQNEIVYFFDAAGRINGLLVRAVGERPPGRTQEFLEWARREDPEELAALMDGEDVDPTGDHPQRMRVLLNRWRDAAGLQRIE